MEQELFKNMYQQIHLDKEQKNRIWQRFTEAADRLAINDNEGKNTEKRFSISMRAAAYVGVLLVSGMTVFAANEFSLTDRLADAMKLLTQSGQEATEEQQNIYAQYGAALDNEIERENGTFRLEAALYDENYLFVPFRYIMNPDTAGYEEITAGYTFEEATMWNSGLLAGYRQDCADLWYGISQDSERTCGITGYMMVLNPEVEEDGVLTGSLLLTVEQDKTFSSGDVIQVVKRAKQPENPDEILTEFTLENALEQHSIVIPEEQKEAFGRLGLSVEEMTVSSISIHFSGIRESTAVMPALGAVVLKDGSTVELSANGGISGSGETTEAGRAFYCYRLFAAPIQVEEIAGIRIRQDRSEVWIPVE
ncbi:MAG: hypothetical protein HDR30_09435 [Lachnospiraceae bacterium]|nr:hypothetical protein [Lachnospiraceae bacterium]